VSGYWIDPERVKDAATAYTELGNRLGEVLMTLVQGMTAEGHCQGFDEYGKSFDKNYAEPKENALEFFPQMRDGLKEIGAGLDEMADTAGRGEGANDHKFTV
jgi:hypothetical protein